MTQDERPPRADIIDILVAVNVENVTAYAVRDERRISIDTVKRTNRTVYAARHEFFSLSERRRRFF